MATITVNLQPEVPEAPVIEEGWRPGSTLRSAARALVNALKGLGDLVIWVIVFLLPTLLLIALPIAVAFFLFRMWRRRKRSKGSSS
jgi:Flp pilus assembly protein TadB